MVNLAVAQAGDNQAEVKADEDNQIELHDDERGNFYEV
jgi:hypothetical protein